MRILVTGCGAVGGYFGGRLLQAGQDVQFLVRPTRAAQLATHGFAIESARGDWQTPTVPMLTKSQLPVPVDVVLLCCKSWDLPMVVEELADVWLQNPIVVCLLNGLAHHEYLRQRLPTLRHVAGYCNISSTLGPLGEIRHLNRIHEMTVGVNASERNSEWFSQLLSCLRQGDMVVRDSADISQELWEKFVFINTLAAVTCLVQASIGEILRLDHGRQLIESVLQECQQVAQACGFAVSRRANKLARDAFFAADSSFTASMFRDMQAGLPIEAQALFGHLIQRATDHQVATPLLHAAWCKAQYYQQQREC